MAQRRYGIATPEDDDFALNPPPASAVSSAQRANPLGAASINGLSGQGITPGSTMSPGAYNAAQQERVNNRTRQGAYGFQTTTPNNWYGKGNEYGMSLMAGDTGMFWTGYGDQQAGFTPGGDMTSFYSDKYDTQALGAALYGKEDWTSDEGRMAGQTAIADRVTAPGVQFFDPGMIIGNVMSALMSKDPEALAKQNPMLAQLLQSVQGNPAGQVDSILGFLQQALSASMPPDSLQAFIGQLAAMGEVFKRELLRSPKAPDNANFAQFLVQQFGPTLGL